jgi:DNA-binding XRE family transcriptional regulator
MKKYDLAIDTFKKCIDIGVIRTDISSLGKGSYMPKILLAMIYAVNNDINKAAMQYIEALFDKNNFLRNGKEEIIDFLKRNELFEILDELNSLLENL